MRTESGFSLIEIIFAFAIMTISLTILMKVFSTGINSVIRNENYTLAAQISESLMASAGQEQKLVSGTSFGTIQNKFKWFMKSVAVNEYKNNGNQETLSKNLKLYTLYVRVAWLENEQEKFFETHSYQLQTELIE